MRIQRMTENDYSSWITMRKKLWTSCPDEKHDIEIKLQLSQLEQYPVFMAIDDLQNPVGFIECSIHDYTPGCHSTPVGYIEGWYVEETHRKLGIGKELVTAAENWFIEKGFIEMASDAELHNSVSIEAHKRLGYEIICEKDGEAKFLKEIAITETVFGEKLSEINYTERAGAYAVILNDERKVALIKTSTGYFLPGGGMENNENFKECLQREVLDETGYSVSIAGWIGKASKYHYSNTLKYYMHGIGYFYRASLGEKLSEPIEDDHVLVWENVDEAVRLLFLEHQKWAVLRITATNNAWDNQFWQAMDKLVLESELVIDRPKGSLHPKYRDIKYRVDYGYLKGTASMDGGGIDVWRGSKENPVVDAVMCIIDLVKRDSEIKLLFGCTEAEKDIIYRFHNESEYMKGILIERKT